MQLLMLTRVFVGMFFMVEAGGAAAGIFRALNAISLVFVAAAGMFGTLNAITNVIFGICRQFLMVEGLC